MSSLGDSSKEYGIVNCQPNIPNETATEIVEEMEDWPESLCQKRPCILPFLHSLLINTLYQYSIR